MPDKMGDEAGQPARAETAFGELDDAVVGPADGKGNLSPAGTAGEGFGKRQRRRG